MTGDAAPFHEQLRDKLPPRLTEAVRRWWDWAVIAAMAVFMFATRMRTFDRFHTGSETYFLGTDPYYHARHIEFLVANLPFPLGYDAMTQYPLGTDAGQFGTLFDQIGAVFVWLIGAVIDMGPPTAETVQAVIVAYPAILGALLVVPAYLLARRLTGKGPALFAAAIIALTPGRLLFDSVAGRPDHHVMEALLSTLALWALVRAADHWADTDLTIDAIVEAPREAWWPHHREAWLASAVAVLAFTAYLWTWSPGVLFVGIAGVWLVVQTILSRAHGRDGAPAAITAATVFLPVALLMVPQIDKGGFSALNYTWMQPTATFLVGAAGLGLAGLGYLLEDRELPAWTFPAAVAGIGVVGLALLWVLFPDLINHVRSGLSWVTGIGVQRTRGTIQEASPASVDQLFGELGLPLYIAIAGFLGVIWQAVRQAKPSATLVVVWAGLITTAVFTQGRFSYYMAVVVAILTAVVAKGLFHLADHLAADMDASGGKKGDQASAPDRTARVLAALILLLALVPVHVTGFDCQESRPNAWTKAGCAFRPGDERLWHNSLVWLRDNTPELPVSLATRFDAPAGDEAFDYPEGTYGILSWWDYGHQILYDGHRPPIANPFQQQAPLAAEIFTAENESQARSILAGYLGPDNDARYLMVDDAMVADKFWAITVWAETTGVYRDYGQRSIQAPQGGGTADLPVISDRVKGWFLQDVYRNDASGMSHFRLVDESNRYAYIGNIARISGDQVQLERINTVLGGGSIEDAKQNFGTLDATTADRALPLGGGRVAYDIHVEAALKVYEHVPGATLAGTAEPGANVTAEVPLVVTSSQRTFTYNATTTAGPDGRFSLTVPYSTTQLVPVAEGGTDSTVEARGPYTVTAGDQTTQVDVPDATVLGGGQVGVTFA